MKHLRLKDLRILSIAPTTRGFGYAVLEGSGTFVDWAGKSVKGDKNAQSLAKVDELIIRYQPGVIILQDTSIETSRRSRRIKKLTRKLIAQAATHGVRSALFSDEEVRHSFFDDEPGTKHELAELIANRFPDELGSRLPPKRRPWTSQDSRMDIFDAVALALAWMKAPAQSKARHLKIQIGLGVKGDGE